MELVQVFRVLFCAAGIYLAYLTQGLVSERLAVEAIGADGASRFKHMSALPWFQSLACFIVGVALLGFPAQGGAGVDNKGIPPVSAYWKAALTASVGPALGFMSLRNISYAAQVVVKSCKMLPVMLVGTLVHKVQYKPIQYFVALILCTGLAVFSFQSSSNATSKLASPNLPVGFFLCFVNLALDGYTNSAEDAIHRKYSMSTGIHMMCWINFWCFIYYTAGFFLMELLGISDTFSGVLLFLLKHPKARNLILQFCWCGAFGQLFIFYTIKQYGSLMNTLVCTTRKFFSILLSVLWNGAVLLPMQWFGVFLVFGGIAWSIVLKEQEKRLKALEKKFDGSVKATKEQSVSSKMESKDQETEDGKVAKVPQNGMKIRNGFNQLMATSQ